MKGWREYVMDVAGKMYVSIDAEKISNDLYEVQRDALSMEWRKRFELETNPFPRKTIRIWPYIPKNHWKPSQVYSEKGNPLEDQVQGLHIKIAPCRSGSCAVRYTAVAEGARIIDRDLHASSR
ncbi:MAG: hypothetical protein E5X76_08320 [Mesorhizobium sp.]|nr:MAG: hypothetical protein E5X72_02610 [Mesorhizobium sp.]TJV73225.1 MAG: hypothetical protein E5X76_08320 [Mesorhizobium sp.]